MNLPGQKTPTGKSQDRKFDGLFVVDLRNLDLNPENSALIEKAIQSSVLAALGALDLAPTSRGGDRIGGGVMMGFTGGF